MLTTDRHEASRGLFATAELLVPPYGSPIILVLPASNIFTKFRRGHPLLPADAVGKLSPSAFQVRASIPLLGHKLFKLSFSSFSI